MTRRELFARMGEFTVAAGLSALPVAKAVRPQREQSPLDTPPPPPQLPGTEPLIREGDLAAQMVEGIHRFLIKQTAASVETRQAIWHRDYSSREAYESSVAPNRKRFGKVIGLLDERTPYMAPSLEVTLGGPSVVAWGDAYKVYSVRWPVLDGVDGEGLLLEPTSTPLARVVALPDADWSPEMLAGLAPGVSPEAQFARTPGRAIRISASSRTLPIVSISIAWHMKLGDTSSATRYKRCWQR